MRKRFLFASGITLASVLLFQVTAARAVVQVKKGTDPASGVVANPPPLHPTNPGVAPNLGGNVQNSGTPLIPTDTGEPGPVPVEGQITDSAGHPLPKLPASTSGVNPFGKLGVVVLILVITALIIGWYLISKRKVRT